MKSTLKPYLKSVSLFCILLTGLVLSCSKSNDATPATNPNNAATIDGKAFAPTSTTAISTGTGLSISLKDASKEITLSTSDKVSGTYGVINAVPSGRAQATPSAVISYFDGTDLYYGASGVMLITVESGKASGSFAVTLKTALGKTIELKEGKFKDIAVGTSPTGKCVISKFTKTVDQQYTTPILLNNSYTFEYNSDGKLIKYFVNRPPEPNTTLWTEQVNYFYSGGVMTNLNRIVVLGNATSLEWETWAYTAGKVTLITRTGNVPSINYLAKETTSLEYNAAGLISKVTVTKNGTKSISVLEYDASGNVTKSTGTVTDVASGTLMYGPTIYTFSNYDTKPNYNLLLAQSLGTSNQVFFATGVFSVFGLQQQSASPQFGPELSKNNLTGFVYQYNANGYVTAAVSAGATLRPALTYKLEYAGCN